MPDKKKHTFSTMHDDLTVSFKMPDKKLEKAFEKWVDETKKVDPYVAFLGGAKSERTRLLKLLGPLMKAWEELLIVENEIGIKEVKWNAGVFDHSANLYGSLHRWRVVRHKFKCEIEKLKAHFSKEEKGHISHKGNQALRKKKGEKK